MRPADTYVHRLADALCAQCLNKGVGGDLTFPELAASEEPFCPDYITIAYGTNDLGSRTKAEFSAAYHRFLEEVVGHFPTARIFAISPIWRSDHGNNWPIGSFEDMDRVIQALCAQFQTVTYVSGISLIPGSAEYFQDKWVHPNGEGFAHYARNLLEIIQDRERVL